MAEKLPLFLFDLVWLEMLVQRVYTRPIRCNILEKEFDFLFFKLISTVLIFTYMSLAVLLFIEKPNHFLKFRT